HNRMLVSLYEDYKDGVVEREDFILIKENFELKKKEAELAIRSLQEDAEAVAAGKERNDQFIDDFKAYRNITELNRVAAVNLLEQVKVYEGRRLEVVLDCNDEIRQILDRAEEIKEENARCCENGDHIDSSEDGSVDGSAGRAERMVV
ncbi:MAG: hypothetical protein IJ733_19185, partial [Lachnospiraceae bacterium]|nr:hypothetical protein [Lachnospiraceae bacterium]